MSLSSNMFKPVFPHQPVATVILVENSEAMSHIWSDLQDQYLNKLVDSLVVANPFVPVCDVLLIYCKSHSLICVTSQQCWYLKVMLVKIKDRILLFPDSIAATKMDCGI
jgi:hypothetical protein